MVKYPTCGIFLCCCAGAVEQTAMEIAPIMQKKSGFLFIFTIETSSLKSNTASSNYPVRSRQHIRRNREADLLCGLEINDELKLCRLLDGEISGFGAFEDLIDVGGGSIVEMANE